MSFTRGNKAAMRCLLAAQRPSMGAECVAPMLLYQCRRHFATLNQEYIPLRPCSSAAMQHSAHVAKASLHVTARFQMRTLDMTIRHSLSPCPTTTAWYLYECVFYHTVVHFARKCIAMSPFSRRWLLRRRRIVYAPSASILAQSVRRRRIL